MSLCPLANDWAAPQVHACTPGGLSMPTGNRARITSCYGRQTLFRSRMELSKKGTPSWVPSWALRYGGSTRMHSQIWLSRARSMPVSKSVGSSGIPVLAGKTRTFDFLLVQYLFF